MENFIKSADKPMSGMVEARAVLTGRGNSVHKVAASASGTATAVIPSGRIRHSLAEWMGINVLSALSLNLAGDKSDTGLRCAVVHFAAKNGVLTSQQFVFDTDPVLVEGSGSVDLSQETMDLRLQGKPKNFQLFRLRAPISITGPLEHPASGRGRQAASSPRARIGRRAGRGQSLWPRFWPSSIPAWPRMPIAPACSAPPRPRRAATPVQN